ncbi:AAA family ATPase [Cytobacillus praedii]|uniref:VWA domain-containing protein n=1 Tax=Cytobacillus praedii TaxID=1742358 RepID=A0A4V2NUP9_9BACI|nr:AAA family ATPase [Cytobacillus praedii]TCJ05361.1 VWA domain-containing protein [Cytobacillus praedii]
MNGKWSYPFTAIYGQEKAKKAILLALINPKIGGVLLAGDKGTAKSTLVRGILPLLEESASLIELPLNATKEQILGGINFEHVLKTGKRKVQHGLLARAHGKILYIDEVNLLSNGVANILMNVKETKKIKIESEGISFDYYSDFLLIGTMNPEEGMLSSKFLDRFGLYVHVKGETDIQLRKKIIESRLAYERDKEGFCKQQQRQLADLQNHIQQAKRLLAKLFVQEEIERFAAEITLQACCEGHRADLLLIETAKAMAALNQEKTLSIVHIQEAAEFVLPHRIRDVNNQQQKESSKDESFQTEIENNQTEMESIKEPFHAEQINKNGEFEQESIIKESVEAPHELIDLSLIEPFVQKSSIRKEGNGKRTRTKTSKKIGRYIKSKLPIGKPSDIAFDATIRVAARYQKVRKSNGNFIVIHSSDLRQKVREKRTGNLILFLVDASGSMGVKKRMSIVKSAILSLLQEAYQKRDKVGLITFSNDESKVLLEPTRSIELANKELAEIPTGGNTPLALGLETAFNKIRLINYKEPDYAPFLVLITDGRANSMKSADNQWKAAITICDEIQSQKIKSMVIDTETGFIQLGLAKELAKELGASYCKMEDIRSDSIVKAITSS